MHFALDRDQRDLDRTLEQMLSRADVPKAARAWADGDPGPGLELWRNLAEFGVVALAGEVDGTTPGLPVEMAVAFEAVGRHAVPGPYVEAAFLATLLPEASGAGPLTVAAPPWTPYALDADIATGTYLLRDGGLHLAETGEPSRSVDPARRLFRVSPAGHVRDVPERALTVATDTAALATAAQLLGLGEALLARSVGYVTQRTQFGRVIGEYQALKHALADVRIGLDFARPLVHGAAAAAGGLASRDVSAAKVAASDAAYRAARTALQVHGAIGYTAEHDLSLWLLKVRALVGAWGSPGAHRARILSSLVEPVEPREA